MKLPMSNCNQSEVSIFNQKEEVRFYLDIASLDLSLDDILR